MTLERNRHQPIVTKGKQLILLLVLGGKYIKKKIIYIYDICKAYPISFPEDMKME